jgi:cholesterol oxidase
VVSSIRAVTAPDRHDYDWIVVGSGFGGSVSALRLAEKGYRVAVLECGRRFEDRDFATSTWQLHRHTWAPRLGLHGIFRMTPFKDVCIVSGSGVGGGSLVYANTLWRARPAFFRDRQWRELGDWEDVLSAHYDVAERMLGVTEYPYESDADRVVKEYAAELGIDETFRSARVGVYFGDEPGETVPDPYFDGEGPERAGCILSGACMIGCRWNAKNTLVKNYLFFAERLGVQIQPDRTVVDVRPVGAEDGSDGYRVTSERTGAWLRRDRLTLTADGVVFAAGTLGTNQLLQSCRRRGSLPRLSPRLGELVRTNSESILAVTAPDDERDFARSVAISSSIYPQDNTHIEPVTYGRKADSVGLLFTLLTAKGARPIQPFRWLWALITSPRWALRTLSPMKWSRRTIILLTMQTLDNAISLRPRRRLLGPGVRLTTEKDPENPIPSEIEAADRAAKRLAERLRGIPQASLPEAILGVPTTAHVLGGAPIGGDPEGGVIDRHHRVFGYEGLLVCDGAAVPANPGVNPSLTITAMAEHAMSAVPVKDGATERPGVSVVRPASRVA